MRAQSVTTGPAADAVNSGSSWVCIVALDRLLRIAAANHDMFHLFRENVPDDLCGTSFCELLAPDVRTPVRSALERLLAGRHERLRDTPVVLLGPGGELSGDLTATAVVRDDGHAEGLVVLVRSPGSRVRSAGATGTGGRRHRLSGMEARVLEGVASGASTVQLASTLFLSRGGVEYHVAALLRMMRVKNRPALVSRAYAMGLFELGSWPPQVVAGYVR